jgi:hypothetical protein
LGVVVADRPLPIGTGAREEAKGMGIWHLAFGDGVFKKT